MSSYRVASTMALVVCSLAAWTSVGYAQPERTALGVFQTRPGWRDLPGPFLASLATRLRSTEAARAFVQFCETAGILERNIRPIAVGDQNPEDASGLVAVTLVSYAMAAVRGEDLATAKRALEFAVMIRPRHVSAWQGMALVMWGLGDCRRAVTWADRVLTFTPDPSSTDILEQGQALAMTPEGERLLESRGMGKVGQWQETLSLMQRIKRDCRQ